MKYYTIENLEIIDAGAEGKAIGKKEGIIVFVPYVVPGDIVDVQVIKKKKSYLEATLQKVKYPSPFRISPACQHFGLCGGCKWQILTYNQQLFYKQKQVEDNFQHLGKFDFPAILPIIPSEKNFYYRNKLEYTFSNLRWLYDVDIERQRAGELLETRGVGFHIPGKFDKILDIQHCLLQEEPSNEIRNAVRTYAIQHDIPFYNIRKHEGILRNIIIRTTSTGELMVIVVMTEKSDKTMKLMEFISQEFPQITSLQYVVNKKLNDTITDLEVMLYKGKPYITETMENLQFKIGPVSFYQTNSEQAYTLYKTVRDFAQISQNDTVYDLYTGTGTIANFIANQAQKVIGIEYVDAAIADAQENAKANNIVNTLFFAGDMKDVLTPSFVQKQGAPNIIITDPPRAGMHPTVVERLMQTNAEKIVYISCNPATQARDLSQLCQQYQITKIQPVDMFPHTHHVENVVVLEKKNRQI